MTRASGPTHEHRPRQSLRPQGRRAPLVRLLGRARRLRRDRRPRRHPPRLRPADAAAQRHGLAAHGPRPLLHDRGHPHPLPPDERLQHALAARDRSRRHRHADRGRAPPPARGHEPPRHRPREVHPARLAVARPGRRPDPPAAARARRQRRLGPLQVHDGPGHVPRRPRGLRPPPPRGPDLPRHPPHLLGLRGPHGALEPRGRERAHERRDLRVRLSHRRRRGRDRRGHHPPRDDARRHRRGRAPRRRALQAPPRQTRPPPVRRPPDPDHHRRDPGRSQVRHRRREGDPRPRLQRPRHRQAPRPRARVDPEPGRHDERQRRPLRRHGPLRRPQGREEGPRGEGPRPGIEAAPARPAPQRAQRQRRRADDLHAVVREDAAARRARARRRPRGQDEDHPRGVDEDLRALDVEHPGLVHLPPALVGPPDPRVLLRRLRAHHGDHRGVPRRLRGLRRDEAPPGRGRARHVVLVRPLALRHARLARGDARAAQVLPRERSRDRLRHPVLLGRPHDDDGHPLHGGAPLQAHPAARPRGRRDRRQDEQGEGERDRSARSRARRELRRGGGEGAPRRPARGVAQEVPQGLPLGRADGRKLRGLRRRRAPLHARDLLAAGEAHPALAEEDRGLPELLQQDLERDPLRAPLHRGREGDVCAAEGDVAGEPLDPLAARRGGGGGARRHRRFPPR